MIHEWILEVYPIVGQAHVQGSQIAWHVGSKAIRSNDGFKTSPSSIKGTRQL